VLRDKQDMIDFGVLRDKQDMIAFGFWSQTELLQPLEQIDKHGIRSIQSSSQSNKCGNSHAFLAISTENARFIWRARPACHARQAGA
jgi:hypothetical protein